MQSLFAGVDRARELISRLALRAILRRRAPGRPALIFAPGTPWQGSLFQRPQQLAGALAAQGALVLYMEPEPSRRKVPFREVAPRLYRCNVTVRAFRWLSRPLVYLMTWNRGYAGEFTSPRLIYDYVDALGLYAGDPNQVRREHEQLLKTAHLVLATARNLHAEARSVRPDALWCPNGVDYGHFAAARRPRNQAPPEDLAPIWTTRQTIIGYYGALARWFDYSLYEEVARRRPEFAFVLIGPDHDGTLDASGLPDLPNVHWLGPKPYEHLPRYLGYFDVATIPFRLNAITHATSPLKLFEYMAGGVPVVTTPMQESKRYPGVLTAGDPATFSSQLDEALRLSNDPAYMLRIDAVARENTWEARARQILEALSSAAP